VHPVLHKIITVVLVAIFLLLCSIYYHRLRRLRRRLNIVDTTSGRRFYKRTNRDPEEQYVQGVGYVIGDISCNYNARSPYMRCAVNPGGLCQDCRYYEGSGVGGKG
jgi:Family of unknown function (DUF6464)